MQRLIPLSARIWHMELDVDTDRPNLGYIRGDRFSLMFDCGASPAHVSAFLTLLQQHGLPKPAFAVLSHWHWDHAMGMAALSSLQIPVIASLRTNEILKEKAAWTWTEEAMQQRLQSGEEILFCDHYLRREYRGDPAAIPGFRTANILFEGERTLDLGGGTLDGKTGTITIEANVGDMIKLPAAPTREGYTFRCWKGSEYEAGAEYKVEGDHAFTAEWTKNTSPSGDTGGSSAVNTGDSSQIGLWLMLLSASLLGLAIITSRRKRA